MIPYWLLFALFALGALFEERASQARRLGFLAVAWLILTLMVGLRWQVGADWFNYIEIFEFIRHLSLQAAMERGDPAYQALNWLVSSSGWDIWVVNLIGGAIFSLGLVRFAASQQRPWLTMLVAVPYLVMVVAMGYTRQGIAIGVLLAGLANFLRTGAILRFAIYVVVAALFHKTAVVAFPLAALAGPRTGFVNLLIAVSISILLYFLFLSKNSDELIKGYIGARYSSDGAGIRVTMSLVPAMIFLAARQRFDFSPLERKLWTSFAIASVITLVMLLVSPSSTAVDRLALYLIPLQLAVGAALPGAVTSQRFGVGMVALYAFAVQFTWLNYATHAKYWVPYSNVLWK